MKHAILYNTLQRSYAIICFLVMVMLYACGGDEPSPEPAPVPPPPPTSRTVLVYMVATNNLGTSGFDSSDINEMVAAAQDGQLGEGRLVLYHATKSGLILKEVTSEGIDTLKIYDNSALSVSIERMRQVIADVKTLAPAEDYGLVLWSHSTGWLQDGIEEPQMRGYRSYGSDGYSSGKTMNITSLRTAIEDADFSFVYFDCCYMGSVELMYELRHCAPYMVGSATEVPADGMPYHINLKYLFDTEMPLEDALKTAASSTFNHYNDVFVVGDCPCTMVVVRSDKLEALAEATRTVYQQASSSFNSEYTYQKFKVTGTCYYFDFDQYVESISADTDLYNWWHGALSDAVVYADATPYIWKSTPILRHCGLSTYILSSKLSSANNNYNTLSWYNDVVASLFD